MATSRFAPLLATGLFFLGLLALGPWVSGRHSLTGPAAPGAGTKLAGPDRERRFFDDWHGDDYGPVLPIEVLESMSAGVARLAHDDDQPLGGSGWELLGPSGMDTGTPTKYSGRILDIDWRNVSGDIEIWVAAASGGLWHYDAIADIYTPLTETLSTQAVGTVSVDPANQLNIVIGTGEAGVRGGRGIFRSTDGGATWAAASAPTLDSWAVHRIRHITSSRLVAATEVGWYLSTDSGSNWARVATGNFYDIALHPTNTDTLYTTNVYDATSAVVYRSTDGGASFSAAGSVLVGGSYRGAVALCESQPWVVYAVFCAPAPTYGLATGVVTSNGGASWFGLNVGSNHMGKQGWYDNTIAVDPTDPQHVYMGGVSLKETLDGGANWTTHPMDAASGLHADIHSLEWLGPGVVAALGKGHGGSIQGGAAALMVGHDGGWSYETGGTFTGYVSHLPITQYTHVHAAQNNRQVVGGGSQDNGMSITTNGGATWHFRQGGDGSTLSIDPNDNARMWSIVGVYNGALAFRRHRSTDSGVTWTDKNVGIAAADTWYTELHNDQVNPVYLYTNAGPNVYESVDYGDSWGGPWSFSTTVRSLRVGRWTPTANAAVWIVLNQSTTGDRVYVIEQGAAYERGGGLPAGVNIRSVIPHPTEPNSAFALVNGFESPGARIFRTLDRGLTWTNVTGNLPNVPLGGIVAHPTNPNELYLGTEMGCFRGWQSGGNWYWMIWNQGMPGAAIVADMTWVDELATTGNFYVIAGTYGRSMYQRDVMDVDVSAVSNPVIDGRHPMLAQNVPNPVPSSSTTRIAFELPAAGPVKLQVFDVSGRLVAVLADRTLDSGPHEYSLGTDQLVPGAYFYRLEAGGMTVSKKLIVR